MKTYSFLILFLLVGLASCKKDKATYPSGNCNDLPGQSLVSTTSQERFQYRFPCFNPNNMNEFVYYFVDSEQNIRQMRKYNMQTGENTLVANTGIRPPIKWGRGGKIAFAVAGHIFTVKENGDDLTQFTAIHQNNYPSWNDAGDELIWEYSVTAGSPYVTLRQKLDQLTPDTIYYGPVGQTDRTGNKLLSRRVTTYGYYDLIQLPFSAENFTSIKDLKGAPYGLCWTPDGESFYVSHFVDGLYKINANTGQEIQLFKYCPSIRYDAISCSPDGRFLLGERVDSRVENTNVIEKHSIYFIDLQTMKETKMNL